MIETDTFRGRERFKVVKAVGGRGAFLGFVRRTPGTATRWQWIEGFGPTVSPKNFASKVKAAEALVAHLESKPASSPPKKLETIGRSRRKRANRRNRRVRDRR